MPQLADLETHQIGGTNFKFSGARIEDLGATEYTLGLILVDVSGSVWDFRSQIEGALKVTVKSCRRSPRADNMMLRVVFFDSRVQEFHGYKTLADCNEADYDNAMPDGGMTALHDAVFEGVQSLLQYGQQLVDNDFDVNACVFVITDGQDNDSKTTRKMVKDALADAKRKEILESIMPVLIGVNTDATTGLSSYLEDFKDEAGFQQYVEIGSATEKALAKLGGFISKSFSSQSQALGTGGPSQSLTF